MISGIGNVMTTCLMSFTGTYSVHVWKTKYSERITLTLRCLNLHELPVTCSSFAVYGWSGNSGMGTFLLIIGENSSLTLLVNSSRGSKSKRRLFYVLMISHDILYGRWQLLVLEVHVFHLCQITLAIIIHVHTYPLYHTNINFSFVLC